MTITSSEGIREWVYFLDDFAAGRKHLHLAERTIGQASNDVELLEMNYLDASLIQARRALILA